MRRECPLAPLTVTATSVSSVVRAQRVRLRSLPTSIVPMLLASIPASVIVYAYTGSSYILGVDGDDALKVRLEMRTAGIPVVIAARACCLALRVVQAHRIALIHPPWFSTDLDKSGAEYFQSQGLTSSTTPRHRCVATLVKFPRLRSTTGLARTCQLRQRQWSSAATVCAPSVRLRRWRRVSTDRSCPPIKSRCGMRFALRG